MSVAENTSCMYHDPKIDPQTILHNLKSWSVFAFLQSRYRFYHMRPNTAPCVLKILYTFQVVAALTLLLCMIDLDTYSSHCDCLYMQYGLLCVMYSHVYLFNVQSLLFTPIGEVYPRL